MKRTFATFAAATALTLSACGAPAEDEAAATSENAAETTTVTQEVTEEATDSPTETESSDDSADGETEAAEGTAPSGDGTPPPPEDGETPQEPEQPEQPDQTQEEFQEVMAQEMRNNGNIGDTFTIDGHPTELCVHGDGYGLNVVTAGANTSCEFAKSVMTATTGDTDPTQDNVRDSMPQTVKAGSPTTNRAYYMDCAADERNLITCVGGDTAVVYMY